ncbi:MAG: DUF262 domain-containing protein [Elusimicrobiales bacterium]|nr:DUF262 domain-containing protein [Elusimicrobiales bacterium]
MKASEANFLQFIKKSPQFAVPIYQRTYSWTERECRQLWEDILRTGHNEKVAAHFIGSIVYIETGLYQVSSHGPLLVIDGQQRLTTIALLIEVLARHLGNTEPVDGFSAKKLRSYYLINSLEEGNRRYKLLLSQTDRDTLLAFVEHRDFPKESSLRIKENIELFEKWIENLGDDVPLLCKGLAKLLIVDISLSRDQDNPQLIFESMNSTGRELTQADLIRNFILMGLEPNLQTRLYERYWRPMETDFGQEAYTTHFDGFMRHFLTVKTGEIPRLNEVYETFKRYSRSPEVAIVGVETLLSDMYKYSKYFCAMALDGETDLDLKEAFSDLRELKVDVAYPFLLELYSDYKDNLLAKEEFLITIRLIESYVFRRAVCNIPTSSLNKTFATFRKAIKKDRYLESIKSHFLLMSSYRRYPTNQEFKKELKVRDLYNFRSRTYWLRKLENHGRKERVSVDEYTIEHIMPQNENLSEEWKRDLGPDWKTIHQTLLHTLGNLTLTGYNSEYSDNPFVKKRDMKGGFKESPLKLNLGLGVLTTWNKDTIHQRADDLSEESVSVWIFPELDESTLDSYRIKTLSEIGYSIDDHPYLKSGQVKDVFEAFRKEVLALDSCVTEEILKLYVAYKAEINFVDVVPQATGLKLFLNIAFHEISDPKKICRDVSGVGHWGNGDVEVGLSSLEELPYVMGLVRQSFEKQMDNGGESE